MEHIIGVNNSGLWKDFVNANVLDVNIAGYVHSTVYAEINQANFPSFFKDHLQTYLFTRNLYFALRARDLPLFVVKQHHDGSYFLDIINNHGDLIVEYIKGEILQLAVMRNTSDNIVAQFEGFEYRSAVSKLDFLENKCGSVYADMILEDTDINTVAVFDFKDTNTFVERKQWEVVLNSLNINFNFAV